MCFMYLDCKLRQDSYGCFIFKLKYPERVEKTYLKTSKQ